LRGVEGGLSLGVDGRRGVDREVRRERSRKAGSLRRRLLLHGLLLEHGLLALEGLLLEGQLLLHGLLLLQHGLLLQHRLLLLLAARLGGWRLGSRRLDPRLGSGCLGSGCLGSRRLDPRLGSWRLGSWRRGRSSGRLIAEPLDLDRREDALLGEVEEALGPPSLGEAELLALEVPQDRLGGVLGLKGQGQEHAVWNQGPSTP
tara:strand:+ start:1240 stop:1845 length:606 start_codon:yes stop_codon:yes gene_type:complete